MSITRCTPLSGLKIYNYNCDLTPTSTSCNVDISHSINTCDLTPTYTSCNVDISHSINTCSSVINLTGRVKLGVSLSSEFYTNSKSRTIILENKINTLDTSLVEYTESLSSNIEIQEEQLMSVINDLSYEKNRASNSEIGYIISLSTHISTIESHNNSML